MTPIIALIGPSGSGKTTLLARLIPALGRRGLHVGAIKHAGHPHRLDRPGSDSSRLWRAGATAVAVQGPRALALFAPARRSVRELARLLGPVDLILCEGFKRAPLPKIEVHRSGRFLCTSDRRVIAVVSRAAPPRPLPRFRPGDAEDLAEFIMDHLRQRDHPAAERERTSRKRPRTRGAARPRMKKGG